MNKDQVTGRLKEVDGAVKEVTGKVVGNQRLEEKGKVDKAIGEVQAGYGEIRKISRTTEASFIRGTQT